MQPPTLKDSAETLEFLTTSNTKEVFLFFLFFVQSFLLCELMYTPPHTHTYITAHAAESIQTLLLLLLLL